MVDQDYNDFTTTTDGNTNNNDPFEVDKIENNIQVVGKPLERAWLKELKLRHKSGASLMRVIIKCYGRQLLLASLVEYFGKCLFGVSVACTLGSLIGDIQTYIEAINNQTNTQEATQHFSTTFSNTDPLAMSIIYKSIFLLILMISSIFASQYFLFNSTYLGMKCRLGFTYLIYRKCLKITKVKLESTSSGAIMNLITNEVNIFDSAFYYLQYMYIAPLQAILIFTLLAFLYLGVYSIIPGVAFVIIYIICQIYLGKSYGSFKSDCITKTDERVKSTNELIDSIAIIKMYAWEQFFEKSINDLRDKELAALDKIATLRSINLSLFYGACKLILMVMFVTYVLTGNSFDAAKVFTAITMTNSMRTYLTLFFPTSIAQLYELQICLDRIRQFLIQDDSEHLRNPLALQYIRSKSEQAKRLDSSSKSAPSVHLSRISSLSVVITAPLIESPKTTTTPPQTNLAKTLPASYIDNPSKMLQIQQQAKLEKTLHNRINGGKTGFCCNICKKFDNKREHIDKKFALIFHEVSAAWPKSTPTASFNQTSDPVSTVNTPTTTSTNQFSSTIFSNLTAHIKHHEFVMIVGRVGAGKSSLLLSILNELPIQTGSIRINGSLSYAAQEPWIFAGTIRENITIAWHKQPGRDYKHLPHRLEQRYHEVLRICCLQRDLERLPYGDLTVVGERGASLSGGQRARVALARALFYEADIYLLDDPLSAVDASVAKYIFEECFKSFLQKKTVLLVTHQVQFSTPAQKVLLLHDSPEFSYGPAASVLRKIIEQLNLDPKVSENDEKTVVPVTISNSDKKIQEKVTAPMDVAIPPTTLFDEGPLGEIESPSLTNIKSLNSEEMFQSVILGSDDNDVSPTSSAKSIADSKRVVNQSNNKQLTTCRSPSLRLIVANSLNDASQKADCETYLYYRVKAASIYIIIIFLIANVACQTLFNGTDYFLSAWTNLEESKQHNNLTTIQGAGSMLKKLDSNYITLIYAIIVILLLSASFARNTIFFRACLKASRKIHQETLKGILYAPMSFFDHNQVGTILARFSTDMSTLDDQVAQSTIDVIEICTNVTGIIIVTAVVSYYNLVPATIVLLVANYFRMKYSDLIIGYKFREAFKRGQVFSFILSTLHGLTTIRVFNLNSVVNRRFERAQDDHSKTWYAFLCSRHRLTVCIDAACMVYFVVIITLSITCVFMNIVEASMIGLLISQIIILPGPLQWGARQMTDTQSYMTSVMRIRDYATGLRTEQDILTSPKTHAPPDWPSLGVIEFDQVYLRYLLNEEPVLKGLKFKIKASEKIGIVGRTGAGKSSIIAVLFRLTEPEGRIIIDGIDTKSIPLNELRKKISIIPQDPILFSCSIRRNLDPFDEYKDNVIWSALECVQLKKIVLSLEGGLNAMVSEGGSNFSVGQRQLMCLARAILRRNKILLLDEATASVDAETDLFIQKTIKHLFNDCTVLTIAHRLQTIMDSDRVLALDSGQVQEFDEPHVLLQNPSSCLSSMVIASGNAEKFKRIAERSYKKKYNILE